MSPDFSARRGAYLAYDFQGCEVDLFVAGSWGCDGHGWVSANVVSPEEKYG